MLGDRELSPYSPVRAERPVHAVKNANIMNASVKVIPKASINLWEPSSKIDTKISAKPTSAKSI